MNTLTPEPWHFDHVRIFAGRSLIADCQSLENARRIVACVNACAGMPDDMLQGLGLRHQYADALDAHANTIAERDALRAQVAELREALLDVVNAARAALKRTQ